MTTLTVRPALRSSTPRIVALGKGWFPTQAGGLNRYLHDLDAALRRHGVVHRPVVIGPAEPGAPARVVADHDRTLPRRLLAVRGAAVREAVACDLVDVHFALFAALPLRSVALRDKPVVVHFHGPWAAEAETGRVGAAVRRAIERSVYRRAAAVVTLSRAFADIVCADYGVDPDRVHVIAPGVDLTRFRPADRRAARSALGLAPDAPTAVSVRRLVPRMGLDVLIAAWARLRTPAHLWLVGDGPARPALERQVARLGLTDRVRFAGRVPEADLPRWYQAADVSCVPSTALEGFGLVVLESLASGTPVLASDVGGLPATVRRIGDDWVLPAGDVDAWSRRLDAVLQRTAAWPATALRAVAEDHSWRQVAAAHLDLYRAVVAGHGR